GAGGLTEARREALEEIDPGWCPAWDTGWQRRFRLAQAHVESGGKLPITAGEMVVQGEDLGRWATACRHSWDDLLPVQQWLLENILNLTPAEEHQQPLKRTQEDKWALNLHAARQYHQREGHLNIPRKHVEMMQDTAGQVMEVKLGTFINNVRKRAAKLSTQRRADLNQLGIRW
ncbi:helicase associated domain-containing protein, partial [Streptomyces sp. ET3-23]|uniref:helicase associated domain-containing protein n=1 Tax=Streptomyces sp. ET3-23 TaxID=2885643 RepID=UPI001D110B86